MKRWTFLMLACLLAFAACKKEEVDQRQVDEDLIQQYITDNGLNATATGSGLYVVISDSGTGGFPDIQSTVETYYEGRLLDGSIFDQAAAPAPPLEFPLAAV
ncbi:MAG: peptidylprolyl isomerase, partial [Bacteroidota bacterium]